MNTPHKHADVLRAIADKGFEAGEWQHSFGDWREAHDFLNPLTHPQLEWRIKPVPKPDVVQYHNSYLSIGYETREAADKYAAHFDTKGMYRLTFDGETGKLKSAEVLP